MTLHTYWLSDLNAVADQAAAILRTSPSSADPFAPDVLVVGGRGVEQWLRRALVQRLDILTNVQLWSPSRLVSDLQRWAVSGTGGGASRLTLAVLSAVSHDASLLPTELQHLNERVAGDHAAAGPLLLSWASRMARTYEQYSLYRPDWLQLWEAQGDTGASAGNWQARLWRAVVKHGFPSANVLTQTTDRLHEANTPGLPPRWTVLHQGRLSPAHLKLLTALAAHREVHLLIHAVTQPLMRLSAVDPATVARNGQSLDALREQLIAQQHEVTNRLDRVRTDGVVLLQRMLYDASQPAHQVRGRPATRLVVHAAPDAAWPVATSLLESVQQHARASVLEPAPMYDVVERGEQTDSSWRVFSCHGALRQVEVVKDALLHALNHDRTLQPRDILILTPDPTRYVPLLNAVFPLAGDPQNQTRAPGLSLHVQGRTPRTTNPVADVLLRLLALANERVAASSVLALIERGPIAERFALTPADAPTIRALVRDAGVRWGIDDTDAQREGLGLADEGTWRRGLTRMLLGVAVLDNVTTDDGTSVHVHGHAPVPGLEGERALLAGRAIRAVRTVLELVQSAATPRDIQDWQQFVQHALALLTSDSGDTASSATRLRDLIGTLVHDANLSNTSRLLSASGLAQLLAHRMDEPVATPGQLGAITVAPLATGWVYPARVIVLLGLDDDRFPGRGSTPWFDQMAEQAEVGDPDERGEQLQTVFDALLKASDQLIITYTGWNRAGTMRLPPSVPVGALEDLLQSAVPLEDRESVWTQLVQRDMPLQPFSARAFAGASAGGESSYDVMSAETANGLRTTQPVMPSPVSTEEAYTTSASRSIRILPLATLLRFLRAPAAEILSRLGVWSDYDDVQIDDVLPITLDRQTESRAVVELAEAQLHARNVAHTKAALKHRDVMPPARLGDVWLKQAERRAKFLVDLARDAVGVTALAAPEVYRVTVDQVILTGAIHMRYGNTLLFLRDGKNADVHLLKPFVTLAFAVAGGAPVTRAVVVDAEGRTELQAPSNPLAVLSEYVQLYLDADRDVPPYAPRTSLTFATMVQTVDESEALFKAEQVWAPLSADARGECEDHGNALLHHISPTQRVSFATVARAVYEPMLASIVTP